MEKKFFLIIPLFYILFSFLSPVPGGDDRYLAQSMEQGQEGLTFSITEAVPAFTGRECTCYASDSDFYVAGFLDGTVLVNGNPLEDKAPGRYRTVYSVALSDGGRYLAVIAGVYPRTLSVYQRKQDSFSLIFRKELSDTVRCSTYLAFSGTMLLYEDSPGISVISLVTMSQFKMSFDGTLKGVAFDSESDHVWVLAGNENGERFISLFLYDGSQVVLSRYSGDERNLPFRVEEH